jgi:2-polyprenyl-3-methyl-5-hydroxy-6-metoxy-1,4-benzoquinol methylase
MYRGLAHHDEEVNRRLDALLTAVETTHEDASTYSGGPKVTREDLAALEARLDDASRVSASLNAKIDAQTDAQTRRQDDLTGRVDQLNAQREEMHTGQQQLSDRVDLLNAQREEMHTTQQQVSTRLDRLASRVDRLDMEMAAAPFTTEGRSLHVSGPDGVHLGFTSADGEASYAGFEDVFRGSEDFVRDRLLPYVDVLKGHGPVLDVGCGRGELLSVLADSGIEATGVDLDDSMLDRARAAGHSVTLGDAVDYLRSLPERSLGSVVSIEVVEHLDLPTLRALFAEAARVLEPGGRLVAETVNPHSPAALKTFWLDLTHVRPLYPEALLLLAKETGFSEGSVVFPHGSGDLEADLREQGEYALVATL